MSYGRPIPSHLRTGSLSGAASSTGQSSALQARINEKKQELASLKELQALSAGLADQMEQLEQKLATLSDGTEGRYSTIEYHEVLY
jgi:DASH complex subunit DAD2